MGLRYTYYEENHNKIGIVTEETTEEERARLKLLYDLDEIRTREE